jgi:hypothetical protein
VTFGRFGLKDLLLATLDLEQELLLVLSWLLRPVKALIPEQSVAARSHIAQKGLVPREQSLLQSSLVLDERSYSLKVFTLDNSASIVGRPTSYHSIRKHLLEAVLIIARRMWHEGFSFKSVSIRRGYQSNFLGLSSSCLIMAVFERSIIHCNLRVEDLTTTVVFDLYSRRLYHKRRADKALFI